MRNTTDPDETQEPGEDAPRAENALGLSASQVIAGGGAAAVASVIGGHLGLAGTVVGAFILSVISAIALPLFRASLDRSHAQLKRVMPKRDTRAGRTAEASRPTRPLTATDTAGAVRANSDKVFATPLRLDPAEAPARPRGARKARMAVGGTAVIFLVGLGSILGFQSATGLTLSNGTSALQSGVSQVVSSSNDSKATPPSDRTPTAPAVESPAVPTQPATDPADEPTPTATPSSHLTQSPKPSAPASTKAPAPTREPLPAVTSAGAAPTD